MGQVMFTGVHIMSEKYSWEYKRFILKCQTHWHTDKASRKTHAASNCELQCVNVCAHNCPSRIWWEGAGQGGVYTAAPRTLPPEGRLASFSPLTTGGTLDCLERDTRVSGWWFNNSDMKNGVASGAVANVATQVMRQDERDDAEWLKTQKEKHKGYNCSTSLHPAKKNMPLLRCNRYLSGVLLRRKSLLKC